MINDAIKEKAMKRAEENYAQGNMNCAEAVMEALIQTGALNAPQKLTATMCGLGGGGGMTGNSCGALCAALIAVGYDWGRENPHSIPLDDR